MEKSNLNLGKNFKFFNFGWGGGGNLVLVLIKIIVIIVTTYILQSKDLIQIIYIIHIFTQIKYFLQLSLNLKYNKYKI